MWFQSSFGLWNEEFLYRRRELGPGKDKQNHAVTEEGEEEELWKTGQLGDHSPQALVYTMLSINGIYYALRSGSEHCDLRHDPPQLQLEEQVEKRARLCYCEDVSKNHQGGLKGRHVKPKGCGGGGWRESYND